MPKVTIVIRTKNEERWIGHCLKKVYEQDMKDFEVVLVDSGSTDHTVEVAKRFPIKPPVVLDRFLPGHAINAGIRAGDPRAEFIVCLSAHCIPVDNQWLHNLLNDFHDPEVAGVYGRQLPLAFSEASDKRDLLITFGLDRRIQVKDYFFHNANSMVRRKVWEAIPFDEQATNVEDRIWGKAVVEKGYKLVYEPDAAVFHHHGIHQNDDPKRAKSVVSVIEKFEKDLQGMPDSFRAENAAVAAILPVLGEARVIEGKNLLEELLKKAKASKYLKSVHVLAESPAVLALAKKMGAQVIERPAELTLKTKTLEDALKYGLEQLEKQGNYPDLVLYASHLFPFRPKNLFDELVEDLLYKGLDTVFAGYKDFQNVWVKQGDSFAQMGEGLKTRETKEPIYEALYGVGCATASHILRTGKLVGGRVGILPLDDRLYTLKVVDARSEKLVAVILRQSESVGLE